MLADIGLLKLLPTIVIVVAALMLRRTFESLVLGTIVGFLLIDPTNAFELFAKSLLGVMRNETVGWIILVSGFFGSLIYQLIRSGGAMAFAEYLLRYVKNRRSALLVTWAMGLVIFIDDYLNALTVGSAMKRVTDQFGVPREMLAYVVDSTAAPICVIIPLSTWAIYVGGLLESLQVVPAGGGMQGYLRIIPYAVYGWVAAALVPMLILRWIPALGAMRKAEQRVIRTGVLIPPNSENMGVEVVAPTEGQHRSMWHFLLPVGVLIGATLFFEVDVLKGVMVALAFTTAYYMLVGVSTARATVEHMFEGFKMMLLPLAIIVWSFLIKEMNDQLGLTSYVIQQLSPLMHQALLPAVAFVGLAVLAFGTGSFWGVYAISFPIIIPLAQNLGVDIWLTAGAIVSAGAFGSHACFFGDTTVLSSASSGCNNMAHVRSQLPYTLLAAGISLVIYLILGSIL